MLAYLVCATAVAVTWTPVALRFWRSWRLRRNPISLSIFAVVVLLLWENGAQIWLLQNRISLHFYALGTMAVSLCVGINFHLAYRWSDKKFPPRNPAA